MAVTPIKNRQCCLKAFTIHKVYQATVSHSCS